jgi:hypothetical protein
VAKLSQLDRTLHISFYACINETITDPEMVALAKQMEMPNLLKCDVPLPGVSPVTITDPAKVELILNWLQASPQWSAKIEESLQCLAEDANGKPFLTSFMPAGELVQLAQYLVSNKELAEIHFPFADWLAKGATTGYFEGYRIERAA